MKKPSSKDWSHTIAVYRKISRTNRFARGVLFKCAFRHLQGWRQSLKGGAARIKNGHKRKYGVKK
jgi:hypothetical protein